MRTLIACALLALLVPTPILADAADDLAALFARERAVYYDEHPQAATAAGRTGFNDRLDQVSAADHARRLDQARDFLSALHAIDRRALGADDQLNHDLFNWVLTHRIEAEARGGWRIPFSNDSGFYAYLPTIWRGLDMRGKADFDDYIARIGQIPRQFDQHIANMRAGIADGFTMPRIVMDGFLPTVTGIIQANAEDTPFFTPFRTRPQGLADDEWAAIIACGRETIEGPVMQAYRDLDRFYRDEYTPAAKPSIAAIDWAGGAEYYDYLVRYYTTVDISVDDVHALGLREVARIRGEMDAVIAETGFEGDFAAFIHFLRTDPQFYAKTPDELIMHASYIAKRIDAKMPSLFRTLARQPYAVEPVPAHLAPNYTTGRYSSAPLGGTEPGAYWVNTYDLAERPLYNLPSLTLHEAVPGHHQQSAIAQELENVPAFRLDLYPHAFGEGWGLYAEKLGVEMGIYRTPYEHFGRLSYEMWRAVRLVVDTGMHAKGWSRDQAIAMMADNTALSLHNVRTEIDRYISWPGQALAYKMGELKLIELRATATAALGPRFNVRDFHDRVLSAGGIPLDILEDRIMSWIEARKTEDQN